jgi:type IX secretion system substrate protein
MKRVFTLITIAFLVSIFVYGQGNEVIDYENYLKSRLKEVIDWQKDDNNLTNKHDNLIRKIKRYPQNPIFKTTSGIKQKLDSTVYLSWSRYNGWLNYLKEEYTFDANGDLIQYLYSDWDVKNNQWNAETKSEYAYNANRNLTQRIYYRWNLTTGKWSEYYKYGYSYDAKGNLIQNIEYDWNKGTSLWEADSKSESTYDANGNKLQTLSYYWDFNSNQWIIWGKAKFTYNTNSNLTQTIIYYWRKLLWVLIEKVEYQYDLNGNLTQLLVQDRDRITNEWIPSYKMEYTYDADGNRTRYDGSEWSQSNSQWYAHFKEEYTYDANGNRTEFLVYGLDQSMKFVFSSKEESTYDISYSISDLIIPFWYSSNSMLTGTILYDWDKNSFDWDTNNRSTYYYSEQIINNIPEITITDLKVYPNPFSEFVSFNVSGYNDDLILELFDILGRKVMGKSIRNQEYVNMEELNSGIYFYALIINGQRSTGKLIKE